MKIAPSHLLRQQTFRVLLQALSQPGRVWALPTAAPPDGWQTVLATLLDQEVSFAVLGPQSESVAAELRELTQASAAAVSQADFLLIFGGGSQGRIVEAKRGSLAYPDQGATLVYLVAELQEGGLQPAPVRLQGPGIPRERCPRISGLDQAEWSYLAEINREFPMGVDCFFLDRNNRVLGLPRSTRVEIV